MKKKLFLGLTIGLFAFCLNGLVNASPYTGADINLNGIQTSARSLHEGTDAWVEHGTSITTYWSPQWVEYTASLTSGNWIFGLNVTNDGNLGPGGWYDNFEVEGSTGPGDSNQLIIAASDVDINNGWFNYFLPVDTVLTVRYTWLNDAHQGSSPGGPPELDANIKIVSAFFDNVPTQPVPEPATMLLFGTGLIGLAGISMRRKKK